MHKIVAVLFGALALIGVGTASSAVSADTGPNIGFAEDATKYADDGGDALYTAMNAMQTTTNRVAVFWNADEPTTIQDEPFLDRMIPVAQKHDIQVVFAVYPLHANQAPTTRAAAASFCTYAVQVMQRYPYVRKVIIGNEPNQPKFWRPIWKGSRPASPAAMEVVLASCYDRLKAFDPTLQVIGVGLSPRGNDTPGASSNSSISPVRWISALGTAYRRSGRKKPLFDTWSWHCYPNVNTDAVEKGYAWPNTGCVNAARVKLALWDAFHGTGQPLPAAYPVDTTGTDYYGRVSKTFVDETGWQVGTAKRSGYANAENVPVISEAKQAANYEKLVHLANCEKTLTDFHIFHEVDEPNRAGFQSGVLRDDSTARSSALGTPSSVEHAIVNDEGECSGGVWQTVGSFLYSNTAVAPNYKTFPYRNPQAYVAEKTSGGGVYLALDAGEGFTFTMVFRKGAKTVRVAGAAPTTRATVKVPAGFAAGTATVVLKAETNPARTTTVGIALHRLKHR